MLSRMPRQTEPSINNALGVLLQGMMGSAAVRSEHVRSVVGHAGLQPDIIVTEPGRAPVIVEAEIEPARSVEAEAKSRLGLEVVDGRRTVEAVIALRYPDAVADSDDLGAALSGARLAYCVFHHDRSESRFPESGWLTGSVSDLADLVRLVSVSQRDVDVAADALQGGIERVAAILDELDATQPGITTEIARLLGMVNVPQTRRMACAIIANALVFHERIAGMSDNEVKPLSLVCGRGVANPKAETLAAWTDILEINYWPIFAVGRDILNHIPSEAGARILNTLELTAGEVSSAGVDNAHDLTGRIFQRLIVDRKYLATFYTLPASAALLARLAVSQMDGVDWSDAEAVGRLRIGDFACGTGALLSAVYEQIAARHERKGGNPVALHPVMMQTAFYGCDVMPSAIHITGSTLSGANPSVGFEGSRLYTLAYGRRPDGSVKIGSLELLRTSSIAPLFNTSEPARRTDRIGEQTADYVIADIPDGEFDMVIMNPPFTRATNHEGAHADVTNPAFAAFGATSEDQTAMGKLINEMGKGTCYHGNAGIASAFAAVGHKKLKPGGVLAFVLPLSAASGLSWQRFRKMLAADYTDLTVLSIAANGKEMSFSSDTGMGECLVVARKRMSDEPRAQRAHFVSLRRRPQGFAQASAVANGIIDHGLVRQIEDGPYGGTDLPVGDEVVGEMLTAPLPEGGGNWGGVRMLDYSLAQTAHALAQSKLWLPGEPGALSLKVAPLGVVGKLGLVDRDITGPAPRGPFDKTAPSPTATYPALWSHDAKKENSLVCEPDSQLQVRPGMEEKAAAVWATASRVHLARGFRFNSQPLGVAHTERTSVGGRAWPNVKFEVGRFDNAFSVWGNGTLGMLAYWWHSNRQVSGRGDITIRSAESMPVLDFRVLSEEQLATAEEIFEDFRDRELKPAYLADADANRALLDRRVVCELLGFDEATYEAVRRLSAKWCAEPSVHGGKKRPRGSRLVM